MVKYQLETVMSKVFPIASTRRLTLLASLSTLLVACEQKPPSTSQPLAPVHAQAAGANAHTEESQSMVATSRPREAASQATVVLPEYYGVYAVEPDSTREIADVRSVSPRAEFLIFDKRVATGIPLQVQLFRWEIDDPTRNRDLADNKTWDKHYVELRTKPVTGQPDMIRIVPARELAPGIYFFGTAEVGQILTVELSEWIEANEEAAKRARAEKRWDTALSLARSALGPGQVGWGSRQEIIRLQRLRQDIEAEKAEAEAESAFSAGRLDEAIDFSATLLKLLPESERAREINEKSWKAIRSDHEYFGKYWEELQTLEGHSDEVLAVAISPDMRNLASGGNDQQIIIWDILTGQAIQKLSPYPCPVTSVLYSPDGRFLVSGGRNDLMKIWDTSTWAEVRTLSGHSQRKDEFSSIGIRGVLCAYSPDGSILASGGTDCSLVLWNAKNGVMRHIIKGANSDALKGGFSGMDKLYAGSHRRHINGLAFLPDGKKLATSSVDGAVKIWDVENGAELRSIRYGTEGYGLAMHPEGKWLAILRGSRVVLREFGGLGDGTSEVQIPKISILSAAVWSAGGDYLLCAGNTFGKAGKITIFPAAIKGEKAVVRELEGHTNWVNALALSRDGLRLASASRDKTVKLWGVRGPRSSVPSK